MPSSIQHPPIDDRQPCPVPLVGLTGNIACGKSTVARIMAGYGAAIIDADLLVRELYADVAFARRVAALFDRPVLATDGSVDRIALGTLVFGDAVALQRLESLVHPAVAALRDAKIAALCTPPRPPAIVLEAVKLIESSQARRCDVVWCVVCSPAVQLRRLMEQRGLSEGEARDRLARQPSFEAKLQMMGGRPLIVIENNDSLEALEKHVAEEWQKVVAGPNLNRPLP